MASIDFGYLDVIGTVPILIITFGFFSVLVYLGELFDLGGSGIKKRGGGVATTHRCIVPCLTQLGFEALFVATTQSITWKTGPSFSLRGLPCE